MKLKHRSQILLASSVASISLLVACGSGTAVDMNDIADPTNTQALDAYTAMAGWNTDSLKPASLEQWIADCTSQGTCGGTSSSSQVAVDPSSSSGETPSSSSGITPSSSSVITPSSSSITPSSSSITPSSSSVSSSSIASSSSVASSSSSAPSSSSSVPSSSITAPKQNTTPLLVAPGTYSVSLSSECSSTLQVNGDNGSNTQCVIDGGTPTWYTAVSGPFPKTMSFSGGCVIQCY